MSHPRPEPAREQRVNPAAVPRVELFSHPPQARMSEQRPALSDSPDGADWRETPFSGAAAEQTSLLINEKDQLAGRPRQPRRAQGTNRYVQR